MNLIGIKTICSKTQELPAAKEESNCDDLAVKVDLNTVTMKLEGSFVKQSKSHMQNGTITTLGYISSPMTQAEVERFVLGCIEELKGRENNHLLIITLNTYKFKYETTDGSVAFVSFVINDSFQARNFKLAIIDGKYKLIPPTRTNKKGEQSNVCEILDKDFEKLLTEKAVKNLESRQPISFMCKSSEKLFTVNVRKYVSDTMVGFADITMFGLIKINGTRILKGDGYLYLSYPSEKKDEEHYTILAYPFEKELRAAIQNATIGKLREAQRNGEF